MKRTYISPETLIVDEEAAQAVMLTRSNKPASSQATVLTKRQVWDDVDDEEEW